MAEVRAVRNTASLQPTPAERAVGDGEHHRAERADGGRFARRGEPEQIAPSTDRISTASGKNACSSSTTTLAQGTLASSLGSFGASFGLIVTRTIT